MSSTRGGVLDTGRLRIEVSHYFSSIEEEEKFLNGDLGNDATLINEVAQHLRKNGKEHIRHVPFTAVWIHFGIQISPTTSIVYAYNIESKKFIGGLLDITKKRVEEHTFKKFSVYNRPVIVVRDGVVVVKKFIKIS